MSNYVHDNKQLNKLL